MTTSGRLRGNVLPIFTLKKGAAAAASFADDIKKYSLTKERRPDDEITYAEQNAGNVFRWTLTLTAVLSFDAGSLAGYLWENAGVDLVVTIGPYGNATPTPTKPHIRGTAAPHGRPPIGNEAKSPRNTSGADFEIRLVYSTDLTRLIS